MDLKADFQKICLPVSDLDMLQEAVSGSNLTSLQLVRGVFKGELLRVQLPWLTIDYGRYSIGVISQGGLPGDRYTIGMILSCSSESRYYKAQTLPGDIVYLPPRCELDVLLGSHPQWCTLSFDKEFFETAGKQAIGEATFAKIAGSAAVIRHSPETARLLRAVRRSLFAQDHLLIGEGRGEANNCMSGNLLELSLEVVFGEHQQARGRTDVPRSRLVVTAEEYLNEQPPVFTRVAELATRLGVSVRTLEYAFQDIYGITPKQYLKIRRLNYARQMIIRDPTRTVTDHAIDAGFWHMSQFAHDYKLLFGETPSETVKRFSPDAGRRRMGRT